MDAMRAVDIARVMAALNYEGTWFRHGLTDHRLAEITGLSIYRVGTARREAQEQGLAVRVNRGKELINILTSRGVARARGGSQA